MPFTLSHTVAVIPLTKYLGKYGALSPLLIGSMTPDIAYLIPQLVYQRMDSHSLIGVYLFCIPMGLTVYFLYHFLMAPVIVSILPKSFQRHLHPDLFIGRIPNIPSHVLVFSIILGALTHIAWDFFTHQSGLPQFIPWMNTPLTSIDGYDIMPYRILQHSSSLFGIILLSFWIRRWHQRNNKVGSKNFSNINHWQAPNSLRMIAILFLAITVVGFGLINGYAHLPDTNMVYGIYSAQVFTRYAIIGSASAFLICCISLGIFYQLRIRSRF